MHFIRCSWISARIRYVQDFYHPQTKFTKVMFLQVSVCRWGGVSKHALGRGVSAQGGLSAQGDVCPGGVCPGQTSPRTRSRHHPAQEADIPSTRGRHPPPGPVSIRKLWDTVNKQAVRILLEGILDVRFLHRFSHSLLVLNLVLFVCPHGNSSLQTTDESSSTAQS